MIDFENISDTIYCLDDGVRYRRIFDEAVLIHQDKAESLVLNETAVSFLELCDGGRSVREIRETLLQQYNTTPEQLSVDMSVFISELCDNEVIHIRTRDQDR